MINKKRKVYPFLNALRPKEKALEMYYGELEVLGDGGLYKILDQGKAWSKEIASDLSSGRGVIFPHTFISMCGYQIAAVVHGVLDSGADEVILLGTAHGFPGEMLDARIREFNGEDISKEPSWGVLDLNSEKGCLLEHEFSLDLFKVLWELETKRRGVASPKLIERYPCLTNRRPDLLPGIDELKKISKNAVIVGTEDYCHHGIAYGVTQDNVLSINQEGLSFARSQIETGFSMLQKCDYQGYFDHWMNPRAIGDPSDVTVVIHHLVSDVASPKILDLKLADVSTLFEGDPSPSWVAAALVVV
ncbi:MAG: hypothetical protein VX777_02020 [Chlamydiota bacterium]|nr:hypothetical protein [Chlamydiota bacterium]